MTEQYRPIPEEEISQDPEKEKLRKRLSYTFPLKELPDTTQDFIADTIYGYKQIEDPEKLIRRAEEKKVTVSYHKHGKVLEPRAYLSARYRDLLIIGVRSERRAESLAMGYLRSQLVRQDVYTHLRSKLPNLSERDTLFAAITAKNIAGPTIGELQATTFLAQEIKPLKKYL
jgi:hypothetical protein